MKIATFLFITLLMINLISVPIILYNNPGIEAAQFRYKKIKLLILFFKFFKLYRFKH
jgi:hypothetical protein